MLNKGFCSSQRAISHICFVYGLPAAFLRKTGAWLTLTSPHLKPLLVALGLVLPGHWLRVPAALGCFWGDTWEHHDGEWGGLAGGHVQPKARCVASPQALLRWGGLREAGEGGQARPVPPAMPPGPHSPRPAFPAAAHPLFPVIPRGGRALPVMLRAP